MCINTVSSKFAYTKAFTVPSWIISGPNLAMIASSIWREVMARVVALYNVMIKGSADYGYYITYQLHSFVLKSYMPQSHFFRHRYKFFFLPLHHYYDLISLVATRLQISITSSRSWSLMHYMWAKQAVCFDCLLTKTTYRLMRFETRSDLTFKTLTSVFTKPS